jgi:CheY-like chemotaxis protein
MDVKKVGEKMKILAVDDRIDDLYLLEQMLKGKGHEVIPANNGKEALTKIKETSPDMIISDILMPEMDGYQLLKKVRSSKELDEIPFVFYTATYTSKKDEEFAYSLGASRFIVKPQEPEKFNTLITKTISNHKEGVLAKSEPKTKGNEEYLKEYNQVLVEKLEDKTTELEKSRDELQASSDFLDSIIDSIDDGIIYLDNKKKVKLTNKKGNELKKVALEKVVPNMNSNLFECSCNFDLHHKNRYYDIICCPVTTKNNLTIGTTIVLRDVTKRRQIKDELNTRVKELEKWQRLTVGREIKMIELKKRLKELEENSETKEDK